MKDERSKLLMVDDSDIMLEKLIATLGEEYHIRIATDGPSALQAARISPPDLILLDIVMPGMDGYEVCRQLKQDPVMQSIPVIFLSSLNDEIDEVRGLETGAIDFLLKPFSPAVLRARVRNYLELNKHRKHLETLVAQRTRDLDEAQHIASLGSWHNDLEIGAVTWSDELYRIFDLEKDGMGMGGLHELFLERVHPEDRAKVKEAKNRAMSSEAPVELEYRILTAQGVLKYIREIGHTRRDTYGKICYLLGTAQDITKSKVAEEERKKLEEQLHQAAKMEAIGNLAGGIAHDFNNMLGVILGYTEMIGAGLPHEDPLLADLEEIQRAATHSRDIARQLLVFSHKQIVSPQTVDPNTTITNLRKTIGRLIGEDIEIGFHPQEGLWKIMMDSSQVDQILINLIVNARDAMPRGGHLTVETRNVLIDGGYASNQYPCQPGEYVQLIVSDNGTGMDKETQSHIFDPFFTTKERGKGTGLGLSMIYGIVKQNNGFINVVSEPGKGTTFEIYIPRLPEGTAEATVEKPKAKESSISASILLVEDDDMLRKMSRKMLERIGHNVIEAALPRDAITICKDMDAKIDIILTDVIMPEMSGRDLKDHIEVLRPGIHVLFMSGYNSDVIAQHGVLNEGVHFIQKPFRINQLAQKINEVIESR